MDERHGEVERAAGQVGDWFGGVNTWPANVGVDLWVLSRQLFRQFLLNFQFSDSGGSTEIIVASSNDDKVEAIREAFQDVFGRATVYGSSSQAKTCAIQPIGFENAELKAKERINNLRLKENFADKIIVAVENFVVELYKNQLRWNFIKFTPKV